MQKFILYNWVFLDGENSGIEKGHSEYTRGPVKIDSQDGRNTAVGVIKEIRHCRLKDLKTKDLRRALIGPIRTRKEMLAEMKRWYPDIKGKDPVTLITYEICDDNGQAKTSQ